MLDVGFHPMVWYPLQTMEKGGVRQVFLVAAGDASAATFSAWASESWKGKCEIVVVAAPEDADTADALAPSPRDSADPPSSSPPAISSPTFASTTSSPRTFVAGVATGSARGERVESVDTKTGRPPKGAHYIGLSDENHLLFMGDEEDVDKVLKIRRPTLRRAPAVTIRTDLIDAQPTRSASPSRRRCSRPSRTCVRCSWTSSPRSFADSSTPRRARVEPAVGGRGARARRRRRTGSCARFRRGGEAAAGRARAPEGIVRGRARPCVAFVAAEEAYCARADPRAGVRRNFARGGVVGGDGRGAPGRADAVQVRQLRRVFRLHRVEEHHRAGVHRGRGGDPGREVQRQASVIGKGVSVGTGVKLINSVVMPRATVEDGCTVQGCVVGPRAVIGAGTTLRECLVEAEYEVEEGKISAPETLAQRRGDFLKKTRDFRRRRETF